MDILLSLFKERFLAVLLMSETISKSYFSSGDSQESPFFAPISGCNLSGYSLLKWGFV